MSDEPSPLLAQLLTRRENRGFMAHLRRYWSPATRHQAYPVLGLLGALEDDRKALVAALFAVNPEHHPGRGVGHAAYALGERRDGEHPYDRHFRRLLASENPGQLHQPSDLARQLHRLLKRLEREGIGLDYDRLLRDLNFWTSGHDQNVKLDWARQFWHATEPKETSPQSPA